jgi:hypothetical protein
MKVIEPKIQKDGKIISTIVSLPDGMDHPSVVIMLHGGPGGRKTGPGRIYETLTETLVKKGIATIRFDFLGEGDSDGKYVDMTFAGQRAEYQQILHYARANRFGSIGLLAESYGGATAVAEYSYDIKCLGLLWPTIDLLDTSFNAYVTPDRLSELAQNGLITDGDFQIGREFIRELQEEGNVLHHVSKIIAPTIIIHGNADNEVPYQQSQAIFDRLSEPKKLWIIKGAGHAIDDPKLLPNIEKQLSEWFTKYL